LSAAERYNKIAYAPKTIDELLVKFFLESHRKAPKSIVLDLPTEQCNAVSPYLVDCESRTEFLRTTTFDLPGTSEKPSSRLNASGH